MSSTQASVVPVEDLKPSPHELAQPAPSPRPRKKAGAATKTWLIINSTGQAHSTNAGKQAIMRRTGLSKRDLRILDPMLFYPAAIMGRERAVVINLEYVKGMITAQDVWLLNSKDPAVALFVEELRRRLVQYHQSKGVKAEGTGGTEKQSEGAASQKKEDHSEEFKEQHDKSKTLPFEFVALEICLDSVCSTLDEEAKALEQEVNPSLDKLVKKVTTSRLERVRQIKGRLVQLTRRVTKIREELEHLLETDGHMTEMYLTRKVAGQDQGDENPCTNSDDDEDEDEVEMDGSDKKEAKEAKEDEIVLDKDGLIKHDVAELEMLVEAYFVQIDGTLSKLSMVKEYVEDTEDYVKILLDEKQNMKIMMGVLLKMSGFVISWPNAVQAMFGTNVDIRLEDVKSSANFLWMIGLMALLTVLGFAFSLGYFKYKRFI